MSTIKKLLKKNKRKGKGNKRKSIPSTIDSSHLGFESPKLSLERGHEGWY
jgi:hypothetical protein